MPPTLVACSACAQLVFTGSCACPHCGHKYPCTSHTFGAAALLGLTLALGGCVDSTVQAIYGVTVTDADDDGYDLGEDCDDDDADIHPDATEVPGDGVDSNCDDEDDT